MSIVLAMFRFFPGATLLGASLAAFTSPPASTRVEAKAEVADGRYALTGTGECVHGSDAAIYQIPAAMWHATVTDPTNPLSYVNVTLWQPKRSSQIQVTLSVQAGGHEYDLATVKGATIRGSAVGRVERRGAGGVLSVEGRTAAGQPIAVSVSCAAFAEPEDNG